MVSGGHGVLEQPAVVHFRSGRRMKSTGLKTLLTVAILSSALITAGAGPIGARFSLAWFDEAAVDEPGDRAVERARVQTDRAT